MANERSRNEKDHSETNSSSEIEKAASDQSNKEQSKATSPPKDEPPDGGYGWVCVACCALINAHTWGINSVGTSGVLLRLLN